MAIAESQQPISINKKKPEIWVNSRAVAFLVSASVASISVAFLSLIPATTSLIFLVTFLVVFAACFLLVYITFEFLIFREINNIYHKLRKIKKKNFRFKSSNSPFIPSTNPIRRVNQEIMLYASQKQKEIEELKRAEEFRREFIADISHELKTPIFAAQGFIDTLLDGAIEDEKVRDKFLQKAAKSLDALSSMVNELLTISQIESGAISMDMQVFSIYSLVDEVADQLSIKASEKNIKIHLIKPTEMPLWVNADYKRITQVMNNLVVNAIKYGNEGGNVWVEIEEKNNFVKISVRDDGPGISEEHLGRIFERFYRIQKSRSKAEGGTGLGLAIVKHIVQKHNSEIKVKSNLNEGTTFAFKLEKYKDLIP